MRRAFTLIEVLVASAIFAVLMTLVLVAVTGSFRTLRSAQTVLNKEQRQRLCLQRLGREVSSLARVVFPETRFQGGEQSFFLSLPKRMTW